MSDRYQIPQPLSQGEEAFMAHCLVYHLEPVREYVFAAPRKWRFDFSWPEQKLAVEIEGLTPTGGRHQRFAGYEADLVKYNTAATLGWRVLRFTLSMVTRGEAIDIVRAALKAGRFASSLL